MAPRLLVVCLGGLAGAGALVCCDMDEGLGDEALDVAPDDGAEGLTGEDAEAVEVRAEGAPIH